MSVFLFEIETLRLRPSSRKSTFQEMRPTNLVAILYRARVDEHVDWRWVIREGVNCWFNFGEHSSDGFSNVVVEGRAGSDVCEG